MSQYPNRVDLRNAVTKAATYGQGVALDKATQAVPSARAPGEVRAQQMVADVKPGSRGAFTRPSERPDEPVTAGMAAGPGAGPASNPSFPMAPPAPGSPQALAEVLRALISLAPNANLIAVLNGVEQQAGRA